MLLSFLTVDKRQWRSQEICIGGSNIKKNKIKQIANLSILAQTVELVNSLKETKRSCVRLF